MDKDTQLKDPGFSHAKAAAAAAGGDNTHRGIFVPIAGKNEDQGDYTLAGVKNLVINTAKGTGSTVHFTVTFDVENAIFQNDLISTDDVAKICNPADGSLPHAFLGFSDANHSTTIGQSQQVGVTAKISNQSKAVLNVEVTMSSGKVNGAAGGI